MKKVFLILSPLLFLLLGGFSSHVKNKVNDYLNTGDTIVFNSIVYKLVWSSHPADNYYKQEYIPENEKVKKYKNMLLIDFVVTPDSVASLVKQKGIEILERKKTDIMVNYHLGYKSASKEYLLDFVFSEGSGGGLSIVEWNGYIYKDYTDKQGHRGILLFGLSKRAYDPDITPFMQGLKINRQVDLSTLLQFTLPDVEIK